MLRLLPNLRKFTYWYNIPHSVILSPKITVGADLVPVYALLGRVYDSLVYH